jgi:hypothetical protein
MDTTLILSKLSFLQSVFGLNKDKIDAGPHPMNPDFGVALGNFAVAEIARDISVTLSDQEAGKQLRAVAKELVASSSSHLVADWEDGGDICPPWPKWRIPRHSGQGPQPDPWRFFSEELAAVLGPSPDPWLPGVSSTMNDIVLAHALRSLASLTTSEKASSAIKQIGEAIVKAGSARLFDDYCATPVKPRIPVPKKNVVAA